MRELRAIFDDEGAVWGNPNDDWQLGGALNDAPDVGVDRQRVARRRWSWASDAVEWRRRRSLSASSLSASFSSLIAFSRLRRADRIRKPDTDSYAPLWTGPPRSLNRVSCARVAPGAPEFRALGSQTRSQQAPHLVVHVADFAAKVAGSVAIRPPLQHPRLPRCPPPHPEIHPRENLPRRRRRPGRSPLGRGEEARQAAAVEHSPAFEDQAGCELRSRLDPRHPVPAPKDKRGLGC